MKAYLKYYIQHSEIGKILDCVGCRLVDEKEVYDTEPKNLIEWVNPIEWEFVPSSQENTIEVLLNDRLRIFAKGIRRIKNTTIQVEKEDEH